VQTNAHTETTIDEVAAGVYRINTPLRIDAIPSGFNVSQYLIVDDEPMVFHTGWRRWFPFVSEAISKVIPLDRIRHIGYSHFEGDEAGAMNEFLAAAPHAVPFASHVGLMTSLDDLADRKGRGLADGETFSTGQKTWQWIDTPHSPCQPLGSANSGRVVEETTGRLCQGDRRLREIQLGLEHR
jgi:flavorubredoxin